MTKLQEIEFKVNQSYKQLKNFKGFSGEYSIKSDSVKALMTVLVCEDIKLSEDIFKLKTELAELQKKFLELDAAYYNGRKS